MAKPIWVHVPGPGGGDTTVQLQPAWVAAVAEKLGRTGAVDHVRALVLNTAGALLREGYDAVRDGPFSIAVRRRAYELAAPRKPLRGRAKLTA